MPTLPLTAIDAIGRLRSYNPRLVLNHEAAFDYLTHRQISYRLLHLYSTFFPSKLSASTKPGFPRHRDGESIHSEREIEFFQLLDQHCFPLSPWTIDQAYDRLIHEIPVLDMGVDWHEEDAFEALKPEWLVLIPLTEEGRYWFEQVDMDCIEWYETEFGINIDSIQHPNKISAKLLRRHCLQADSPFKFLPLTLAVLNKSTNNLWLDALSNEAFYGTECETSLPWSVSAIQTLQRQWKKADHLMNQCYTLTQWLAQDLPSHFRQLLDLWNQPYPPTTCKPLKPH